MSRLAYLVVAHADPAHLARLARRLAPASHLWVHLDAKADPAAFAEVAALPGVFFAARRVSVSWGGMSMTRGVLATLREMMASGHDYGRVALISGTCYPLCRPEEIEAWFLKEPEREILRWLDMRASPQLMEVISRRWFKDPLLEFRHPRLRLAEKTVRWGVRKLRLPNPHPWPEGLKPCWGSSWWALSTPCVRWILGHLDANPWMLRLVGDTFGPDEHFFHTLVANSPFAAAADGEVPFEYVSTVPVANFHHLDPGLQKWYGLDDWDEVVRSGMPFLRKVRSGHSDALLERIDAEPRSLRHPVR